MSNSFNCSMLGLIPKNNLNYFQYNDNHQKFAILQILKSYNFFGRFSL